jgi:hypothetical protein
MGIAGTNREGMRKYRRFVENLKDDDRHRRHLLVRNVPPPSFLARPLADTIGQFASRNFFRLNGGVTVLSRSDGAFLLIPSERA